MATHVPENNKVPNREGRMVFNRFENQNTLKATGVRPIFADEDYTVASKQDFMVRLTDQDRQAEISKKRNTGLDGVDFGGPEFIRGKINLSKVAGYLLFRSTNKLRTWLDFEVADLVHEYATCIINKFHRGRGRPDIDTTLTTVRRISDLPAATIIRDLGPAQFEVICERHMVLPGEDMGGDDPDLISPTGTCIAAIFKILRHSSHADDRFVAVHLGELGQPQYLGFGINAWHRGWVALLAFLERRLPTGSTNLFPNARKEAVPIAAPYIFYDAEVSNADNDTAVDNAEPGNETRVHPTAVSIIAQAELYLKGPVQMERETNDDDEEDDLEGVELADFQDRGMRTLVALNPGTNLKDAIRERCLAMGCKVPEPIEPSAMITLLQYARDICSPRVTDVQDLAETTRSFGTMVGTGDDERHAAGDGVDITDEDAVQATSIIAKMTEDDMPSRVSVESAMEALGKSDWKDTAINPNVPEFRVQYHQALDAAAYCQMLSSPTRFALAAIGCGVGKTTEAFTTIWMRAREADAKRGPYYPTFFLAPPGTVAQVLREGVDFFRGLLNFKLFFGEGRKKEVEERLRPYVLDPKGFENDLKWCKANTKNPIVARRVYISSYNTASSRLLTTEEEDATPSGEPHSMYRPQGNAKFTFSRQIRKNGREVVRKYSLRSFLREIRFSLIVIDEAHACKNPANVYSQFVRTLQAEAILAMTATPMPNNVKDILGMIRLLWSVSILDPIERFSRPELLGRVFADDFDPRSSYSGVSSMIDDATGKGAAYQEGLDAGNRLWILNPLLFEEFANCHGWRATFCNGVLREALRIFAVRRTLTTAITLPDNTVRFPGQLTGLTVMVEELKFPDRQADEAAFRANEAITEFTQNRRRRQNHRARGDESGSEGDEMPALDCQRSRAGRSFFARHRRAALMAFDLRNAIMADPEYRVYADGRLGERQTFLQPPALGEISTIVDGAGKVIRMGGLKGGAAAQRGPLVGSESVNNILQNDIDGGASYYYRMTCKEETSVPPSTRSEMLFYVISKSPVLARIFIACHEHASKNEKALFITDSPWTQQQISYVITLAGYSVESIRSAHKTDVRWAALDRFNDPKSDSRFLLMTFKLGGQGLNVHKAASHVYIVEFPHNLNAVNQAIGRLTRLGQTRDVVCIIFTTTGTYSVYQDSTITHKYAGEISATINLGALREHLHMTTLEVVVYELIRAKYGQPFDRFVWKVIKCKSVRDYYSPRVRSLGKFFSQAANLAIQRCQFWTDEQKDIFSDFLADAHNLVDDEALERVNSDSKDYSWILRMALDWYFAGEVEPVAMEEPAVEQESSTSCSTDESDEEESSSSGSSTVGGASPGSGAGESQGNNVPQDGSPEAGEDGYGVGYATSERSDTPMIDVSAAEGAGDVAPRQVSEQPGINMAGSTTVEYPEDAASEKSSEQSDVQMVDAPESLLPSDRDNDGSVGTGELPADNGRHGEIRSESATVASGHNGLNLGAPVHSDTSMASKTSIPSKIRDVVAKGSDGIRRLWRRASRSIKN